MRAFYHRMLHLEEGLSTFEQGIQTAYWIISDLRSNPLFVYCFANLVQGRQVIDVSPTGP